MTLEVREVPSSLNPEESGMIVAGNGENHPLVESGAILAVGEHHDCLAIGRVRNDEVAKGVVGSPVPQYFAVLVPLDSPAETPG